VNALVGCVRVIISECVRVVASACESYMKLLQHVYNQNVKTRQGLKRNNSELQEGVPRTERPIVSRVKISGHFPSKERQTVF
jgi:hypothetical protein